MSNLKIDQEDFNRRAQHILDTVVKPQVERYEKKSKLRKLILALKVKAMTNEEWKKARLNAYKPVK